VKASLSFGERLAGEAIFMRHEMGDARCETIDFRYCPLLKKLDTF
jgi:hypothetical protein